MASAGEEDEHLLVELRNRRESEQRRLAELRRRVQQATTRAADLKERMVRDRHNAAAQAEILADQAEAFAAHLEAGAVGPARPHRLKMAEREREIAAVERRNTARLREAGSGPLNLETPPPFHDNAPTPPPIP